MLNESKNNEERDNTPLIAAIDIAKKAGDILLSHFRGDGLSVSLKPDNSAVTEADHEAEDFIVAALKERFPEDGILGEETGMHGNPTPEKWWLIDPLDGTGNFAAGEESFAVMISRANNETVELSVVYQPTTRIMAYGQTGWGVKVNDEWTRRVAPTEINKARPLLSTMYEDGTTEIAALNDFFKNSGKQWNSYKSAGINVLALLIGEYDLYVMNDIHSWDVAPVLLLLAEAGMVIEHFDGSPVSWRNPGGGYVAAVPPLHQAVQSIVKETSHVSAR